MSNLVPLLEELENQTDPMKRNDMEDLIYSELTKIKNSIEYISDPNLFDQHQ